MEIRLPKIGIIVRQVVEDISIFISFLFILLCSNGIIFHSVHHLTNSSDVGILTKQVSRLIKFFPQRGRTHPCRHLETSVVSPSEPGRKESLVDGRGHGVAAHPLQGIKRQLTLERLGQRVDIRIIITCIQTIFLSQPHGVVFEHPQHFAPRPDTGVEAQEGGRVACPRFIDDKQRLFARHMHQAVERFLPESIALGHGGRGDAVEYLAVERFVAIVGITGSPVERAVGLHP